LTADEILHDVWLALHRTAHGIEVPAWQGKYTLSADEAKLYNLLTKRLLKTVEDDVASEP
jgi:hypothetical protein